MGEILLHKYTQMKWNSVLFLCEYQQGFAGAAHFIKQKVVLTGTKIFPDLK